MDKEFIIGKLKENKKLILVVGIILISGILIGVLILKEDKPSVYTYPLEISTYEDVERYEMIHVRTYRISEKNIYIAQCEKNRLEAKVKIYMVQDIYYNKFLDNTTWTAMIPTNFYYEAFEMSNPYPIQWTPPFKDKWHVVWWFMGNAPYYELRSITIYEEVIKS